MAKRLHKSRKWAWNSTTASSVNKNANPYSSWSEVKEKLKAVRTGRVQAYRNDQRDIYEILSDIPAEDFWRGYIRLNDTIEARRRLDHAIANSPHIIMLGAVSGMLSVERAYKEYLSAVKDGNRKEDYRKECEKEGKEGCEKKEVRR